MHKYAITAKPPEASGVFNGLLAAIVAGVNNGEYANSISFANFGISEDPDQAPRGYANANYTVCPRMDVIDPTSTLAISARSAHRRNPTGTVGYTHHHVALETLSHISSMFAKWITEFNVLYANASLAQAAIKSGSYTRLDSVREARYTDGDIEAFLAAVGPLNDGNISFPPSQTIDVDVIYSRVMTQLQNEIGILDNIGFTVGEDEAKRYIGLSTIPKTGQNVCLLSSATYDALLSAPWRRLLTLPRARDMVRVQFEQRMEAVLGDIADGAFDADNPFVTISEGDDVLFIPTHLPMVPGAATTTWDSLTAAIDARNLLSLDGQEPAVVGNRQDQANSGRYDSNAAGEFVDSWLNQFYDMGDLVESFVSGQMNPLQEGLLTVLLSCPVLDDTAPVDQVILGPVDGSSGALGSLNVITRLVEPISGSIDIIDSTTVFTGLDSSAVTHSLPNGIMYIGDCASAKATSWIRILRELRLNFPQEVKLLLASTGRAKKTLATTANRIASMDSLLAEIVSTGQRDGYISMPTLAFNVTRLTRDEQEGPLFAGGSYSVTNPGAISATPQMASEVNGWDRTDNSDGRYLITPDGVTVNMEFGTPSRFTGEWDAGRIATWAPDFVSDSVALGSGSVEVEVTKNLLSLPYAPLANGGVAPRYVPGSGGLPNSLTGNKWTDLQSITTVEEYNIAVNDYFAEFVGYEESISMESYHLTRGFVRGLAQMQPDTPDNLILPGFNGIRDADALSDFGRHPGVAASFPLGSTGIQTYLQSDFADATQPYNAYLTGPTRAPGIVQWFWDPCRTQAFGPSWHRWAGVMFENHLPHPYLPHPVAVPTAYCRLSDLVDREAPNETNLGAFVCGSAGNGFLSMGGQAFLTDMSNIRNATSTLSAQGSLQGLLPSNPSTMWKAQMTQALAIDIEGTAGGLADPGWDVQIVEPDRANVLPVNEMMCLVTNGCARATVGKATMTTVLRNLGDTGSSAIATVGFGATPLPMLFEGETLTSIQNFNGSQDPQIALNQLVIGGKGLLFEGDLYTSSFLDPMAWMVMTYSGEESLIFSHFSGYWAPWDEVNGFISVFSPQVGCNYDDAPGAVARQAVLKPALTATGVNLVKNDWFRKVEDLPAKHARMRSGSLVNPWVRAISEAGVAHLRYDNSQLSPIFATLDRSILSLGMMLQTGLTNSNFLEIQMAN